MVKHAKVSNDVMSKLSDIGYVSHCAEWFCVTEEFLFYVIEDYSYMCTRGVMLFYRNKG